MKRAYTLVLAAMATLAAGCGARLRGAHHHHPQDILRATLGTRGAFDEPSRPPRVDQDTVLLLAPVTDRTLAPVGLLLQDGVVGKYREVYNLAEPGRILRTLLHRRLRAAGARVMLLPAGPTKVGAARGPEPRALEVAIELKHLELHRWRKDEPIEGVDDAHVDLVRVQYAFHITNHRGDLVAEGLRQEDLAFRAEEHDDLDEVAGRMTTTILTALGSKTGAQP